VTTEDFKRFFQEVLNGEIPASARDQILAYWKRFHVEPVLCLDDARIHKEFAKEVHIAAVANDYWPPCLYRFAFRPFLFENAPPRVARTVVQHELIHCYLERDKSPSEFLERRIIEYGETRSRNLVDRLVRQCQQALVQVLVYSAEESAVTRMNREWDGDDKEAADWCEAFIAQHGIPLNA